MQRGCINLMGWIDSKSRSGIRKRLNIREKLQWCYRSLPVEQRADSYQCRTADHILYNNMLFETTSSTCLFQSLCVSQDDNTQHPAPTELYVTIRTLFIAVDRYGNGLLCAAFIGRDPPLSLAVGHCMSVPTTPQQAGGSEPPTPPVCSAEKAWQ